MTAISAPRIQPKVPAKNIRSTTTIGGVTVELMPVRGKGNLSAALIKRIVRAAKASRTPARA